MMKTTGKIMLLLGMILLTACAAQAAPTTAPTPDLNPLRTEVAATVLAQVPQICALTPTATLEPTVTPTQTASATFTPTSQLTVTITGTAEAAVNDRAEYVSQSIQDGTRFAPGEKFNMTWTLKNAGPSTWKETYILRFYSGNAFGASKEILLGREVKPNETVEITVAMTAPTQLGEYRSDWVMSNEARRNFNEPVFLKIVVGKPTVTPTFTATVAPTAEPTEEVTGTATTP